MIQDEPTYGVRGQRERGEIKPPPQVPPPTPDTLRILGIQLGEMLADKNERYGSAFMRVPEMLKLYFPDGIRPDQYGDVAMFIWMFEKQARIAACPVRGDVEDPYIDIAGFGVLGSYLWPKHRTPTQTWTEGERRGPGAPSPTCSEGVPCCRENAPHQHVEDRIVYTGGEHPSRREMRLDPRVVAYTEYLNEGGKHRSRADTEAITATPVAAVMQEMGRP